jgi:hypothetical protein
MSVRSKGCSASTVVFQGLFCLVHHVAPSAANSANGAQFYAGTPERNDSPDDTCVLIKPLARQMTHHDKLTSNTAICNARGGFAMRFSVGLSPHRNGSTRRRKCSRKYPPVSLEIGRQCLLFATIGIV